MDKIKCTFLLSMSHFKKWTTNPRIYIIFIISFLYLHSILSPITNFCLTSGYRITPYIFPYVMSQPITVLLIMLAVVLLFCDAPFIGEEQIYIIVRSGRIQWLFGCIIYIALASILFFLLIVLFTILIFLPTIELSSQWGKVIGTFAQTSLASQYGISIPFSQTIFTGYSPLQAMLLTFCNCCSISFVLGMIIFLLNLKFTKLTGTITSIILILWQIAVKKTWSGFIRYSPVSWVSLSNIDIFSNSLYPNLTYIYIVIFSMSLVTICLSIFVIRKRDIQVVNPI